MKKVTIRRCPVWAGILEYSARVADELRKRSGIEVQMADGGGGEFTMLVDGREVIKKEGDNNPPLDDVLAAVREAVKAKEKARR